MKKRLSPKHWAINLTDILRATCGADYFPVNVEQVAKEYSRQVFPDDPITVVKGDSLPGFDGALFRAPQNKKGWGIFYNKDVCSKGRINFTLAHELGHYLIHRNDYPNGIECGPQDMFRWESEYGQIEYQANQFAATLLMPFGDFRRQINASVKPTLDDIGKCAEERYKVSLTAATLRWTEYTERRSVVVVSRGGFILWARSSTSALKTGAFFRTANVPPVPIPSSSLAAHPERGLECKKHSPGVWFKEPCEEIVCVSDQYDFTISLLHLGEAVSRFDFDNDEPVRDVFDSMRTRTPGTSWLG